MYIPLTELSKILLQIDVLLCKFYIRSVSKSKDPVLSEEKSDAHTNRLQSSDYSASYKGQTGRDLEIRVNEHRSSRGGGGARPHLR